MENTWTTSVAPAQGNAKNGGPVPDGSKNNPTTVAQIDAPPGSQTNDQLGKVEQSAQTKRPNWNTKVDAITVCGISAVTAAKATKNVLVATDNTGKLPLSIIPSNPSAYTGPTTQTNPTRTAGTVYTNSNATAMWVSVKSGNGSNGNVQTGLYATIGTSAGAAPSLVVSENASSSAGGGPPVHSVYFIVLPNFQYRVDTISIAIDTWTEWV